MSIFGKQSTELKKKDCKICEGTGYVTCPKCDGKVEEDFENDYTIEHDYWRYVENYTYYCSNPRNNCGKIHFYFVYKYNQNKYCY
jgi:hypothetical protein